MKEIIIWDDRAERIHTLEANLRQALTSLQIQASIQINCEPPLLARNNLTGNTPAIQINGVFWTHTVDQVVSKEQFIALLQKTM